MNDNPKEKLNEPDGSESRFNNIIKPNTSREPLNPPIVFESWMDPQPEPIKNSSSNDMPQNNGMSNQEIESARPPIEIESDVIEQPEPVMFVSKNQAESASGNFKESKIPPTKNRVNNRKPALWLVVLSMIMVFVFLFTPIRVTTLILGIDWRPSQSPWLGRSDTMIVTTIPPVSPQVSMLSIPRDLWVSIPNHYDNRINTAHYFAELETPNSGMQAAKEAVEVNFGVKVNYVVRVKFTGFVDVVDAFGGVTVNLPEDMSGLKAGPNHLNGKEALAFVRDRKSGDDFYRLKRGQLFIASAIKEVLNPLKWPRIPAVLAVAAANIETDLPIWLWPRTAYAMLFSALKGFDAQTIDRDMVNPFVTDDGAQVLGPNWDLINPMVEKMFK